MDAKTRIPIADDRISLKEIVRLLQRRKWLVILVTLVLGAVAATASFLVTKTYRATIIVSANTESPGNGRMGGLSSVVSEFSGLASLAGLALGGDSRKAESIAVLQSEALVEGYIRDNNLLTVLYPDLWDARAGRWKVANSEAIPTVWKATQRFKHSIANVTTDAKTGLVTLTVKWKDPHLAAKWANDLVKKTNDYLRAKAIVESERNITYLNGEAAKTDVVGVKQAVYAILQNEIAKQMLARGSDEYALKVVDPAVAPETPYSPQPLMWTLIGLFTGVLLSVMTAFVCVAWEKS